VAEAHTGVRVELAAQGVGDVATGLPVLDHLVRELAVSGRFRVALEVAPGSAEAEVAAAAKGLGEAVGARLRADGASGRGFAWLPEDEALAGAVLEVSERPLVASNVDFGGQRVGGLASDVVGRFLNAFVESAGLNLHIRVVEGKDPEHVLVAIFKALGAALGQACRPEGER